jgi:hypothetical protein
MLDDHFGALGGWIAGILVKLGDLKLEFLPADEPGRVVAVGRRVGRHTTTHARRGTATGPFCNIGGMTDVVLLEVTDRIATITLNRPRRATRCRARSSRCCRA